MSNLDTFVKFSKPPPKALDVSQEIRDRGSKFVASVYRASNANEAAGAVNQVKNVVHSSNRATHEMAAWRYMVLKRGRDGLAGPDDFEVKGGSDDDGENYGGSKVLRTMEAEGVLDAVVVVSRWYGGTMLGPARFNHIETCAREVCRSFKVIEEVEACIAELTELDDQLTDLRTELASLSASDDRNPVSQASPAKAHDYSILLSPPDLPKSKRLLVARRNAVKSVQNLISKKKQSL